MEIIGKDLLKKLRKADLKGELAHKTYSPSYRLQLSHEEILNKNPKLAAVNILLYLKNNEWYFPLMLRTKNENDRHSGQVSLPGGKREKQDANFQETAIRETSEELGIDQHYIKIIREISPIYIPPSNFFVHTFVSFTKKEPVFIPQEDEAEELIEFPVSDILSLSQKPELQILPSSRGMEVPVISFNQFYIWGATAMILNEFSDLLKKL